MQFKVYLVIECGIWLPVCYVACYRYQPTLLFMRTNTGKAVVDRTGAFLLRWVPSWHAKVAEVRESGGAFGRIRLALPLQHI